MLYVFSFLILFLFRLVAPVLVSFGQDRCQQIMAVLDMQKCWFPVSSGSILNDKTLDHVHSVTVLG